MTPLFNQCHWCRKSLSPPGGATIPYQLGGDARRAHKRYQIEILNMSPEHPSGDTQVCAGCAQAVREAIVAVYLARRELAPENIDQIEALEERNAEVEAEKAKLEKARIEDKIEADRAYLALQQENERLKAAGIQRDERALRFMEEFFPETARRIASVSLPADTDVHGEIEE